MTSPEEETKTTRKRRGRRPAPKPEDGSREAKRLATAILEVLAGTRTPTEAATALSMSLPRYYGLEAMAIAGLVTACEPRSTLLSSSPEVELATLKKAYEKLERECARHQALARITQRTIGLSAPPVADAKGKKKRGRKPRVRALQIIAAIGSAKDEERTQAAGSESRRSSGRLANGEAPPEGDPPAGRG